MFSKILGQKGVDDSVKTTFSKNSISKNYNTREAIPSTHKSMHSIMKSHNRSTIVPFGKTVEGTISPPRVQFGKLTVREFVSDIGGSVSSSGLSVGLGTTVKHVEELSIDEYERKERGQTGRSLTPLEFWLPPTARLRRLQLAGVQKDVITLETRHEEILRQHRAAAMVDNSSVKLLETDPSNYANVLANIRKSQLIQQQRLMLMASTPPPIATSLHEAETKYRHRHLPHLRQRQGTPLGRRRSRREQSPGISTSPYTVNNFFQFKQHKKNHKQSEQSSSANKKNHQLTSVHQRYDTLSNARNMLKKLNVGGQASLQRKGGDSVAPRYPIQTRAKHNNTQYRPQTALGRIEVHQHNKGHNSGKISAGSNRSDRPTSSYTCRRGLGGWGSTGRGAVSFGQVAKGITPQRYGGRKKLKKKINNDHGFNRFWKINSEHAGNDKQCSGDILQ